MCFGVFMSAIQPIHLLSKIDNCGTQINLNFVSSETSDAPNNRTMLALDFICEGRRKRVYGFGSNKNQAKKSAAKIALRALKL